MACNLVGSVNYCVLIFSTLHTRGNIKLNSSQKIFKSSCIWVGRLNSQDSNKLWINDAYCIQLSDDFISFFSLVFVTLFDFVPPLAFHDAFANLAALSINTQDHHQKIGFIGPTPEDRGNSNSQSFNLPKKWILIEKKGFITLKFKLFFFATKKNDIQLFFRARYQLSAKAGIGKGGCLTLCFCSGPLALERI